MEVYFIHAAEETDEMRTRADGEKSRRSRTDGKKQERKQFGCFRIRGIVNLKDNKPPLGSRQTKIASREG